MNVLVSTRVLLRQKGLSLDAQWDIKSGVLFLWSGMWFVITILFTLLYSTLAANRTMIPYIYIQFRCGLFLIRKNVFL